MKKDQMIEIMKEKASEALQADVDVYIFDVVNEIIEVSSPHMTKEGIEALTNYFTQWAEQSGKGVNLIRGL